MTMAATAELGRLAQPQWGLVTARQAIAGGVSRMQLSRMSSMGVLERVGQGVYRMAGAPPHDEEEILATWLTVSDGERTDHTKAPVVAGAAAARLHGIGDLRVDVVDLIASDRRTSRNPHVRIRRMDLTDAEVTRAEGVPTLTPMRTLADLVESWVDLSLVADALRDAHDRGMADLAELARYLQPLAQRDGLDDGTAFADQLAMDAGIVG